MPFNGREHSQNKPRASLPSERSSSALGGVIGEMMKEEL
jgi:hypothetical protein